MGMQLAANRTRVVLSLFPFFLFFFFSFFSFFLYFLLFFALFNKVVLVCEAVCVLAPSPWSFVGGQMECWCWCNVRA